MPTRAYFVSDLHLVSGDDVRTKTFVRFLEALRGEGATHLFLVGDVFDFWIGDHQFFIEKFSDVVKAIRSLVRDGIQVHYFEGNHDLHLRKFWQDEVGVRVHPDAATFDLGDHRVRVEHGDLINPDDKGYLFLRKFLRSLPMKKIAHGLPSAIVRAIGERASRASRDYTSHAKSLPQDEIRRLIRMHAARTSAGADFDFLISGHVHVRDDHEVDVGDRKVRSVNLGSWFDVPKAFVLDDAGGRFEVLA